MTYAESLARERIDRGGFSLSRREAIRLSRYLTRVADQATNSLPQPGHPDEDARLRLYLSSPGGCSAAWVFFAGLFWDISTRGANVLQSLRDEMPDAAEFLLRMYRLSPRELRFRDGCGNKTFNEISDRLDRFRHHLRQHLSTVPEPE